MDVRTDGQTLIHRTFAKRGSKIQSLTNEKDTLNKKIKRFKK